MAQSVCQCGTVIGLIISALIYAAGGTGDSGDVTHLVVCVGGNTSLGIRYGGKTVKLVISKGDGILPAVGYGGDVVVSVIGISCHTSLLVGFRC